MIVLTIDYFAQLKLGILLMTAVVNSFKVVVCHLPPFLDHHPC